MSASLPRGNENHGTLPFMTRTSRLPSPALASTTALRGPAPAEQQQQVKTVETALPETRFEAGTKRAEASVQSASVPASGNLGWSADASVQFSRGSDADAAQAIATGIIDTLKNAASLVGTGVELRSAVRNAATHALALASAIRTFADKNPLLQASDMGGLHRLISTLREAVPAAEAGQHELVQARRAALLSQGFTELTELKGVPGDRAEVAKAVADKAANGPVFHEFMGALFVAEAGATAKQVLDGANDPTEDAVRGLRNALSLLSRRVEVTAAQFAAPRSAEAILEASIATGAARKLSSTTVAGRLGGAFQQLINHEEIRAFASTVLELAHVAVDSQDLKDPKAAALQQANHWVTQFGTGDTDLAAVWKSAFEAVK